MYLRTKRASKGYLCAQSRLVVRSRRLHVEETCFMRPRVFQLTIRSRGNSNTSTTTTKNKSEKAKIKSAELPSNRYHAKKFAPIRVLSRARMLFFYAECQLKCTLSETWARVLAIHDAFLNEKFVFRLSIFYFFLFSQVKREREREEREREREAPTGLHKKKESSLFPQQLSLFATNTNALSLSLSLSLSALTRAVVGNRIKTDTE